MTSASIPVAQRSFAESALFVRWLPMVAFVAVVANYLWYVWSHAINVPYQDDIVDFLQFAMAAHQADSLPALLQQLYSPYTSHRTGASRLVVYLALLVEGEINFHTLTMVANAALPLMLLLFLLRVREEKYCWVGMLVAALFLLNLRVHEAIFFSQCAFAYFYVFLYGFAALYALQGVTPARLVLAACLAALSTFTLASGLCVWVLGVVSLVHQRLLGRNVPIWYVLFWLAAAAGIVVAFRWGVSDIPRPEIPDEWRDILAGQTSSIAGAPLHEQLIRYVSFFVVLLGSAVSDSSAVVAGVAGTAVFIALCVYTLRARRDADTYFILCAWFVVASAAAVTFGRATDFIPEYILDQRYVFFSTMMFCVFTLVFLTKSPWGRSPGIYLAIIPAAAFYIWAFWGMDAQAQRALDKRYVQFNKGRFYTIFHSRERTVSLVNEAIAMGVYRPPCRPMPACGREESQAGGKDKGQR